MIKKSFTIAHMHRYQRKIAKLESGIKQVHELQKNGEIISAEKIYNRKLCYAYAETRVLLKGRFERFQLERRPEIAMAELQRVRKAFNEFFEIGESYHVDLSVQKQDTAALLDQIEEIFKNTE